MSVADIVVVVVLLVSGIIALRLGIVRVVLGLGAWVGATFATMYAFPYAQPYGRQWVDDGIIGDIAAGAAVFVVSMIVLSLVSSLVAGGVRDSSFGALDRTFGLLAGLAIGATIVSGGYIFSKQVFDLNDNSDFYRDARSLPLVRRGAAILSSATPESWQLRVDPPPAADSEGAFRNLLIPQAKESGPGGESGYNNNERQEMDRLIRSHQ
ncbi:MAG: CvpA family protein [Rhodospirillaceae bacterium]